MKVAIRAAALAVALAFVAAGCSKENTAEDQATDQNQAVDQAQVAAANPVERGQYIVETIGCADCHSPKNFTPEGIPVPDATKALSGHPGGQMPPFDKNVLKPGNWYAMAPDLTAYAGPWGVSYAANLTPDDQTGIGLWTEDVFVAAIRNGKHMGAGRPILPPMPWYFYKNLTDDDLKAVFAYLKSIPAISNAVPAPVGPAEAANM
jgi:hypothetical protein